MDIVRIISLVLLIVGGINWGLVGLADLDLVAMLFGQGTTLSRFIYILVGASALVQLFIPDNWSRDGVRVRRSASTTTTP
jgi:hypothetical protein